MDENTSIQDMFHTLFEIQMKMFYDQCDLIFAPMEDIVKGEGLTEKDFEAA